MSTAALPSAPRFKAPPGAADCHVHVMGPFDRFPLPDNPGYLPPTAPVERFIEGLDLRGLARGVIVQSSSHGRDLGVLFDAVQRYPQRLRGVGLADDAVTDDQLAAMRAAGIRGLRFTGHPHTGATYAAKADGKAPGPKGGHRGSVPLDTLYAMAPRLKEFGLHAQLWMHCDELAEHAHRLLVLGVPLVLDHMGRFDTASGLQHPGFRNLVSLLRNEDIWVKMIPQRNSVEFPGFADVRPFHAALVEANPDRLVWGSDWPHPNSGDQVPDGGRLLDLFAEWTSDADLQRKILASNPAKLYGF